MEDKLEYLFLSYISSSSYQESMGAGIYHIYKVTDGVLKLKFGVLGRWQWHVGNINIIIRKIRIFAKVTNTIVRISGGVNRNIELELRNTESSQIIHLNLMDEFLRIGNLREFEVGISVIIGSRLHIPHILQTECAVMEHRTQTIITNGLYTSNIDIGGPGTYYIKGITIICDTCEFGNSDFFEICISKVVIVRIPMVVITAYSNMKYVEGFEYINIDMELLTKEKEILIYHTYMIPSFKLVSERSHGNISYIISYSECSVQSYTIEKIYSYYSMCTNIDPNQYVWYDLRFNTTAIVLITNNRVKDIKFVNSVMNTAYTLKYTDDELNDCFEKKYINIHPTIIKEIHELLDVRLLPELVNLIIGYMQPQKILNFVTFEPFISVRDLGTSSGVGNQHFACSYSAGITNIESGGVVWAVCNSSVYYINGLCCERYKF